MWHGYNIVCSRLFVEWLNSLFLYWLRNKQHLTDSGSDLKWQWQLRITVLHTLYRTLYPLSPFLARTVYNKHLPWLQYNAWKYTNFPSRNICLHSGTLYIFFHIFIYFPFNLFIYKIYSFILVFSNKTPHSLHGLSAFRLTLSWTTQLEEILYTWREASFFFFR